MDNAPNPLVHAAIALAIFGAVYLVTGTIFWAWAISTAFYPLHEGYQLVFKGGKGYGLAAWVVPVVACFLAALGMVMGRAAVEASALSGLPNIFTG